MRPLLPPEKLWLNVDEVNRRLKSYPRITFKAEKVRSSVRQKNLPVAALPEVTIQSQQKNHWDNYVNLLSILKEMYCFRWRRKVAERLCLIYFQR